MSPISTKVKAIFTSIKPGSLLNVLMRCVLLFSLTELYMPSKTIRSAYVKVQVMVSARDGASGIEYAIVAAMCAAVIGIS